MILQLRELQFQRGGLSLFLFNYHFDYIARTSCEEAKEYLMGLNVK